MPDVSGALPSLSPPSGSCMGAGSQSEHQGSRNRSTQQCLCVAQRSAALSGSVHLRAWGRAGGEANPGAPACRLHARSAQLYPAPKNSTVLTTAWRHGEDKAVGI